MVTLSESDGILRLGSLSKYLKFSLIIFHVFLEIGEWEQGECLRYEPSKKYIYYRGGDILSSFVLLLHKSFQYII